MPALPPPLWAELYYDSAWNDITRDVSTATAVTASRGRASERDSAGPGQGSLSLINTSGKFSRRNPGSDLYGKIGLNTPTRYGVKAGLPWLDTTSGGYASTPSSTGFNITADLEIRAEFSADVISNDAADILALAGRWGASGSHSWILALIAGYPRLYWTEDGTDTTRHTATAFAPLPAFAGQRLALKVTFDVDDGAGGIVIRFYWAKSVDDPDDNWHLLNDPIASTAIGTQTVYNPASQELTVGDAPAYSGTVQPFAGRVYRMQLRDGIGGTVLADFDTSYAAAGQSSFADAGARTWTLQSGVVLSNRHTMLSGEIPSWTPTRDKSGGERRMPIKPAGILQRLGSGKKPLRSPIYRDLTSSARTDIAAYWPLEDGQNSTQLAPGLPSLSPGTFTGALSFAADSSWLGSDAIPTFTTGAATFNVPAYTDTGELSARLLLTVPTAGVGGDVRLLKLVTDGTATIWEVYLQAGGGDLLIRAYDDAGTSLLDQAVDFNLNGTTSVVILEISVSGSTITWKLITQQYTSGLTISDVIPGSSTSNTFSGTAVGRIREMKLGGTGDLAGCGIGHLSLATSRAAYTGTGNATMGWNGEGARARFLRLCEEEGVPGTCAIDETFQPLMGVQGTQKFLDLLREIETTDMGLLGERQDGLELIYRGQSTLWNQAPVLEVDWRTGVIDDATPKDDDRAPFNEMTAKRAGGSEYTYVLETGTNSVADIGRYDTSVDLSLSSDTPLASQAYRRVAIATVDEMRYPVVKFNLANDRTFTLFDQLMKLDHGDKVRLTNVPDDYGTGTVELLVYGDSGVVSDDEWSLSLNCVPAERWNAAVADSSTYGRADTAGCELAEALDASQTHADVLTTAIARWVDSATYPTDFPFDVKTGGEVMRVTACASVFYDAFGRTVASGWGTSDSGSLYGTGSVPLTDYAVGSGYGSHTLTSVGISRRSYIDYPYADFDYYGSIAVSATATGGSIYGALTGRYEDSDNVYLARLEFTTSGSLLLAIRKRVGGTESTVASADPSLTYAAGTFYRVRFQGSGTALRAKVWPASESEPVAWHIDTTDSDLSVPSFLGVYSILAAANTNASPQVRYDNLDLVNPQTFTVTRAVNGVSKAHSAGQDLSLSDPVYVAM